LILPFFAQVLCKANDGKIQANKCPTKITKDIAMDMRTLKNVMQTFTRKNSDVNLRFEVKCDV
jgi:hypothetical protein